MMEEASIELAKVELSSSTGRSEKNSLFDFCETVSNICSLMSPFKEEASIVLGKVMAKVELSSSTGGSETKLFLEFCKFVCTWWRPSMMEEASIGLRRGLVLVNVK